MKRNLILTFLTLLLSFALVQADDVGVIAPAEVNQNSVQPFDVDVYWNNDLLLQGSSIGLRVSVTGAATVWLDNTTNYLDIYPARGGLAPGALAWNFKFAPVGSTTPDTVLTGGAYSPPPIPGLTPDNSSEPLYPLELYFDGATAGGVGFSEDICIDSCTLVAPGGTWLFDAGTGNTFPTFNNNQGPVCFDYVFQPCQAPAFVTVPPGDVLSLDHCTGGTFQFTADPVETAIPGIVLDGYDMVSGAGGIDDAGLYTVGAGLVGTSSVTVRVFNTCPQQTDYTFTLNYTNVGQAYTNPGGPFQVSQGKIFIWDFGLDNFDCDPLTEGYNILSYVGPGTGTPDGPITIVGGVFTFGTTSNDVGLWEFEIWSDDLWGPKAYADISFILEVTATSTFGVRIPKIGEAPNFVFQGHYAELPVYLDYMGTDPIGGFDFLIAYDASALTFINAERGAAIDCWEYFTYRNGPFGNCSGMCPTGMLRVVAMAEANNGPYHPTGCDGDDGIFATPDAELVKIKFYVTDDRTYECQFVPVYWFWLDCGDNAISNWTGETLYISNHVYNINWVDPNNEYWELIPNDGTVDEDDHMYGAFDWCDDPNPAFPNKPVPIRDIDFFNGGIDIACANEIDARGDLNLNNLPNEIADAVLYTNYFIYGPPVFNINLEGQIAASDVNNDGRVLTVGDLVYLIRILTGDATPFPKLTPFAHEATVRASGEVVSISSPVDVGAALFVFDGEATVTNLTDMDMLSDVVDGQTRVLVYNIGTNSVDAGTNELVRVSGGSLIEAEVADYNGNQLTINLVAKIVPKAYALHQNYPNPFNPCTQINVDLPEAADWSVDVYNVAGQLVKSYSGYSDAGVVKVNVDAGGWASGIYFYKAIANDFVATKKMLLMK